MSHNSGEQHPAPEDAKVIDLMAFTVAESAAAYCTFRIIDLIDRQPAQWGTAVGGIGFIALIATGLAANKWGLLTGSRFDGNPRQRQS